MILIKKNYSKKINNEFVITCRKIVPCFFFKLLNFFIVIGLHLWHENMKNKNMHNHPQAVVTPPHTANCASATYHARWRFCWKLEYCRTALSKIFFSYLMSNPFLSAWTSWNQCKTLDFTYVCQLSLEICCIWNLWKISVRSTGTTRQV